MNAQLLKSVVLIRGTGQGRDDIGTGFVVHSDEAGAYVVTCTHVLTPFGPWETTSRTGRPLEESVITAAGRPAQVVAFSPDEETDLAVLYAPGLMRTPLTVRMDRREDAPYESRGYEAYDVVLPARQEDKPTTKKLATPKLGVVESTYEDYTPLGAEQIPYLTLRANKYSFQPGHSGGPLFQPDTDEVMGVVRVRGNIGDNDFSFRGGYAVGIEALATFWADMPEDIRRRLTPEGREDAEKRDARAARRMEDLYPLCDRGVQFANFTDTYTLHQTLRRGEDRLPHLYFICGVKKECPEDFLARLTLDAETPWPSRPPEIKPVEWPWERIRDGASLDKLFDHLRDTLFDAFVPPDVLKAQEAGGGGAYRQFLDRGLAPWAGGRPVAGVALTITPESWCRNGPALLNRFIDFWAQQSSPTTHFIAFVSLVYPDTWWGLSWMEGVFGGSMRHAPSTMVVRRVRERLFSHPVRELGPVERFEAEGWLKEYFTMTDVERERLLTRLYGGRRSLPMSDLKARFTDLYPPKTPPGGPDA